MQLKVELTKKHLFKPKRQGQQSPMNKIHASAWNLKTNKKDHWNPDNEDMVENTVCRVKKVADEKLYLKVKKN